MACSVTTIGGRHECRSYFRTLRVSHVRYGKFQMAAVALPCELFRAMLERIYRFLPSPLVIAEAVDLLRKPQDCGTIAVFWCSPGLVASRGGG